MVCEMMFQLAHAIKTHHNKQRAPLAAGSAARAERDDEEDAAEDEEEDADVVHEGKFRHLAHFRNAESLTSVFIHEVEVAKRRNDDFVNEELEDDSGSNEGQRNQLWVRGKCVTSMS